MNKNQQYRMAKIQIKSEKIATYDGIFHFMDVFEGLTLEKLMDSALKNTHNSASRIFIYHQCQKVRLSSLSRKS